MTTTATQHVLRDFRADAEPVLSVRDLHVSFASEAGTVRAVRGVSFDLLPGRTLGIVGESGSGKSVTSLSVMGLLDKNARVEGSIRLKGRELLGLSEVELSKHRGNDMAMVFQDPLSALTPVFSIGDQLAEALDLHQDYTRKQVRERSIELLDLVGIPNPAERLKSFPHQFSGGMRQRVMIAIAIANNPDVIIADEPTTALDVTIQAQVLDVLKTAQRETGAAVVMITHDLGVVAGVADDVLVMYAGRPVERASVDELYARPAMPYTMGLLGAVPRPDRGENRRLVPIQGTPPSLVDLPVGCPFAARCPLVTDACLTAEPALAPVAGRPDQLAACIRADEIAEQGLTFEDVFHVEEAAESKLAGVPREKRATVLEVTDLKKHFPLTRGGLLRRRVGTVKAVDGVTFDVREGETLALVGESGSGKTTTLMEIMKLAAPQGGQIAVLGKNLADLGRTDRAALRRELQIVFQDPMSSLDPRMPVYDVLAEPLRVHGWSKERINERIAELMKLVGLNPDHVDRFPAQFSGGQRQRIAIARALAVEPKLVVLDEPVSALDVSIQAGVINLLEDLQATLGVAFLFVAHDLSVIRHISARVAVMYLGQVVEQGDTEAVFTAPRHPYTEALLSAVPLPDPTLERDRKRVVLTGDQPSPAQEITGCRFAGRCPVRALLPAEKQRRCDTELPVLVGADHAAACHYPVTPGTPGQDTKEN
ncbi:ABC transporter ATP-binding protein [Xylanimonas protaetiae]|uniref:ABC transporter ATP-binding protein n=1 Tax=Xylanimonas protaetiae TaxID=2509457 RepID=A0A4P6FFR4_9MICO|nr:ABC transporter ATP-binding protein [Xylanimonas protaetiae]QAY69438.1 ABC transporter ATP-binding protein [Xylanimonas protaetiae]